MMVDGDMCQGSFSLAFGAWNQTRTFSIAKEIKNKKGTQRYSFHPMIQDL
jgi:hypothetical protein